jgi:hypothetical protein
LGFGFGWERKISPPTPEGGAVGTQKKTLKFCTFILLYLPTEMRFSCLNLCPLAPTEVEILFVFFSKTKRLKRKAGTNLY